MASRDSRARALEGPWECRHYAHMINNVEYVDSTGETVNICAYWDQNFGNLLEKAWAVPLLVDLLQQIVNDLRGNGDHSGPVMEAEELLERLA